MHKLSWALILIGMALLILITLLTTTSITKRYITGREIVAVINIAEFCLVIIAFLGLGLTQMRRKHIEAEFLFSRLPKRWQQFDEIFISIVSLFFAVILVWASSISALDGFRTKESVVAAGIIVTMWPIRFALPVGVGLYILVLLFDFVDSIGALTKKGEH